MTSAPTSARAAAPVAAGAAPPIDASGGPTGPTGPTATGSTAAHDGGGGERPDPERLQAFVERFGADQAATMHAVTVVVGDRLGLYATLAEVGPCSAHELATATDCHPRLVQEWLGAQVASAYCEHDPSTGRYWLSAEQAACLAEPSGPTCLVGGAIAANSNHRDVDRVVEAFAGDGGIGWHEHGEALFVGTQRFFEPVYRRNLVAEWIPALDGVRTKLEAGAKVADVGCGQGVALILLAQAFPHSTFAGFDYHRASIEAAREAAAAAGVSDRVTFEVAGADDFPGSGYDLICVFNALHEWGDPVGASRHIRRALASDGTWMFTEPRTDERLTESVRARTFYSTSTVVCTPSALSQGGEHALGAQAGEAALRQVAEEAGFRRLRCATTTPAFMVLEARP